MHEIKGGITTPIGFVANGVHAGIKPTGKNDLALITTDRPCPAVGVFTTNQAAAACVRVSKANLANDTAQAIIVNSGNANCCTGERGMQDALHVVEATARQLDCRPVDVLNASTGPIGRPLPVEKLVAALPDLVADASADKAHEAAKAILTTDTCTKETASTIELEGVTVRFGAMAKGSGMIEPTMRTMLAFITTDAVVDRQFMLEALRQATDESFNRITVDGDQSTNDMVLVLANGRAGNAAITRDFGGSRFQTALTDICRTLAKMIVLDGEGATKFIEVVVQGAASTKEADAAARAIANSNLLKCAFHGQSPNWGRVMAALGSPRANVTFDLDRVEIAFGDFVVARAGAPVERDDEQLAAVMAQREIRLMVSLNQGTGRGVIWTSDLTAEYVKINV